MMSISVQKSIIRIVGIIGNEKNINNTSVDTILKHSGYILNEFPLNEMGEKDNRTAKILKDYFYADFRNIMFFKHETISCSRYINHQPKSISFTREVTGINNEKSTQVIEVKIRQAEVFLFKDNIGLFSLAIEPGISNPDLDYLSNLLYFVRNFDASTTENIVWHEWISKNYLGGIQLRGDGIKADEYSGSKFKVFSAIDITDKELNKDQLLFDLATNSPIGTTGGETISTPDYNYYNQLMGNQLAFFKNWKGLCLFDTFTFVGNSFISSDWGFKTWDNTYFRIYIYRLFFKYNLYRYNAEIFSDPVKLRNQFETFLNNYNISNISFNFIGNEIYNKTGDALEINKELESFQLRINRLSAAIQEKKQSKTNALLQFVSIIGGIGSVQPVFDGLSIAQKYLDWSNSVFYTLLVMI